MDNGELVRCFEAVIFACGEPIEAGRLAQIFELEQAQAEEICAALSERLEQNGSALRLSRTNDRYQLCTRSEYGPYIRAALEMRRNTPLSNAAMETLAIIAYNEPVTRNIIEKVRGVDCSGVVSSLITKGLIEEKGRLDLPGRPMQYQTTSLFLRTFGIESLAELPPLPQFGADAGPDGIPSGITDSADDDSILSDKPDGIPSDRPDGGEETGGRTEETGGEDVQGDVTNGQQD